MKTTLLIVLLAAGILCISCGLAAPDTNGSPLPRFLTGRPFDATLWLLIGGILCAALGAIGLLRDHRPA